MSLTTHIAMWSGPRNLSTAMMRSFAARGDCHVSDEPLYAHYLATTGLQHPMRDAVIASQSTDWRAVVETLTADRAESVWYQKHMAHHLLPTMSTDWFGGLRHALLIRHPARVLASYASKRTQVEPADLGFEQQVRILEALEATGAPVVVVDSADILADPAGVLEKLCGALGIPWTRRMLAWPAGPHPSDGVWASHWYGRVWESTGFGPPEGAVPDIERRLQPVYDAILPHWQKLSTSRHRLG